PRLPNHRSAIRPEPAWRSTIARPRFTGAPPVKPIARALSSQRKAWHAARWLGRLMVRGCGHRGYRTPALARNGRTGYTSGRTAPRDQERPPMSETVTSQAETLLMEKDGPIGWITFNQPHKRNAVSQEMWQRMPEYVHELSGDNAIRVVILRGAGETAFVAGADISQFKDRRRNAADEEEYRRISAAGSESLARLGKPLVAMIQGFCIGGGVSIAITCDLRIAADDARFGIPAARLGLGYHYK